MFDYHCDLKHNEFIVSDKKNDEIDKKRYITRDQIDKEEYKNKYKFSPQKELNALLHTSKNKKNISFYN